MDGFQLTFFTQQDRNHAGMPLGQWLLQEARKMGFRGGTLLAASEGFGHGHRLHSAHFFELSDQPVEVTMALTADEAGRFLERLKQEQIRVFYVKTPIEFGFIGDD